MLERDLKEYGCGIKMRCNACERGIECTGSPILLYMYLLGTRIIYIAYISNRK